METIDRVEVETPVSAVAEHAPRPSLVRRLALRVGAVFATLASLLVGFGGVAHADALPTPTDLPAAGTVSTQIASTVSNSLTTQFVGILPYVIAVAVLFTIFGIAMKLFRLKRRP